MKSDCALQPAFWRNQGLVQRHSRVTGEIVHVGTGIVTEDAGFRLGDKPRTRPGIERFALFRGEHLRRAQITPLGVCQRDGRNGRHQVLQMHQHL